MANLVVDTNKLNECGQDIIALTKELNEEFNALFSRISNMSSKTYEWVGNAANDYIRRTNLEKKQYIKLINSLNKYGKELIEIASDYKTATNNLR